MAFRSTNRRAGDAAARQEIQSAEWTGSASNSPLAAYSQVVFAELIGSHSAKARGIEISAHAPVPALCRRLIAAGCDPRLPMHCYRGNMLALRVSSLESGARLTVKEPDRGTIHFARYTPFPSSPVRPSVRSTLVTEATGAGT